MKMSTPGGAGLGSLQPRDIKTDNDRITIQAVESLNVLVNNELPGVARLIDGCFDCSCSFGLVKFHLRKLRSNPMTAVVFVLVRGMHPSYTIAWLNQG